MNAQDSIGRLKPFTAYRPSSVEWLGDVPEHWELSRLKGHAANVVDLARGRNDDHIYLALENVESWTGKYRPADEDVTFESQVKRFRAGDVLFGKLRPYLAKVACPNQSGVCVGELLVLRPNTDTLSASYLEELLRSKPTVDAIDASTFGAKMPRADWQFVGDMLLPLPPLPEQRAIVRYLDYVDRRIRRYVDAKRKLIALLDEEKLAVINQAVTRGLDPNVRLKPSGVEWLGDVPEHWEVRRAKFLYREADQRSATGTEELMSVSHITGVTPRKKSVTMFVAESNIGYKLCRPGDIVINTMWAFMAALGVAQQSGLVSPSYGVYRPLNDEGMDHTYIDCLLRTEAYRANYTMRSTGITSSRLRLYADSFLDIPLLCPPTTEQNAIVEHFGQATAATNAAISRANRQVELVEEYRTRLIADVVTGKLDVRDAAAQILDQAEDDVPIGEISPYQNGFVEGSYDAEKEPAIAEEVTT